ncbi:MULTISPECIES: hypothetical protein [Bradyrhizobium]|jgi:hypothetical protein|uniref:Class I SAM-dependent methyltransferase n=1 Tax=Bradyrhizobium elkanii TaxID=29448 RepID=A0ABV4EQI0_BRAEL|nr:MULTISPECIES: hypothetical protein [Bradyrhizobium]MCP1758641.1 hypothetical protein [Bradyrhizobium elkanii]MCP1975955.1 hypothetical protein [Bradyrhizobium elkanii]MCP1984839.1 hypothetical protein [Bradyrhizobium elkanii]MCS3695114.1 hypothetical protein [Bradyrhizobium elkanii]MCS3890808.1 hypothetical protein [Bradyrhizobium elkanii]
MSSGPDQSNWYWQGIRQAEQDGLIYYACKKTANQFVISDDYSHLGHDDATPLLLKYTNARPLSSVARQILALYRSSPDIRFLELGPGAGVACAAVDRLLPGTKIDTISLTPLNPYLRFRWDDMYEHMTEPNSREKRFLRLYSSCRSPFVRNQYIGQFSREISLPKESYHFIYENHGAIFYNFHPDRSSDLMQLSGASISVALSLLRRDGTMLIMASDGRHRMEDALESIATDTDVIVTCKRTSAYHSFPCIVARNESPLSTRLREDNRGLLRKAERILRLDAQALEKIISRIVNCESRPDHHHRASRRISAKTRTGSGCREWNGPGRRRHPSYGIGDDCVMAFTDSSASKT